MTTFFAILLVATLAGTWKFKWWDISDDNLMINILKGIRLVALAFIVVVSLICVALGPSVEKDITNEKKIELAEKKIEVEKKKANHEKQQKEYEATQKEQQAKDNAETKRKNEAKASEEGQQLAKEQEKVTSAEQATLSILNSQFSTFGTFELVPHDHYKAFRMTLTDQALIDEVNTISYNQEAYRAWENGLVVGMVSLTTGDSNIMPPTQYGTYSIQVASPVKAENNILEVSYGNVAYDFAEDFK